MKAEKISFKWWNLISNMKIWISCVYDQEQLLIFNFTDTKYLSNSKQLIQVLLNLYGEVVSFPDMEFVTLGKFSVGAIRIHELKKKVWMLSITITAEKSHPFIPDKS